MRAKKRSGQKKKIEHQNKRLVQVWWTVGALVIIAGLFFYFRDSPLQRFNNFVVEGSSEEGATLLDGMNYADGQFQAETGRSIWGDVADTASSAAGTVAGGARDAAGTVAGTAQDATGAVAGFAEGTWSTVQDKAGAVVAAGTFRSVNIQKATAKNKKTFKYLIIGNDMSLGTLKTWCGAIKKEFGNLEPYSSIKDQFTIDCGVYKFDVPHVDDNNAALAWMLLLAKLQKQRDGYDYVMVLEAKEGRSFSVPGFASITFYRKGETVRINMHEFSHAFAALADEYSSIEDIKRANDIMSKMGLNYKIKNQLDYFKLAGYIDPPNCKLKPTAGCGSWYEGCALVSTGVCRPSQNSMMRNHLYEVFNKESSDRILEVAKGKRIITRSSIFN